MRYFVYCFLIFLNFNCRNNNVTIKDTKSWTFLLEKPSIESFSEPSVENLDKINGFRGLKMGMCLDSFSHEDWKISGDSSQNLISIFKENKLEFKGIKQNFSIKLTFLRKKLCKIDIQYFSDGDNKSFEVKRYSHIEELLSTSFGNPTYSRDYAEYGQVLTTEFWIGEKLRLDYNDNVHEKRTSNSDEWKVLALKITNIESEKDIKYFETIAERESYNRLLNNNKEENKQKAKEALKNF